MKESIAETNSYIYYSTELHANFGKYPQLKSFLNSIKTRCNICLIESCDFSRSLGNSNISKERVKRCSKQ